MEKRRSKAGSSDAQRAVFWRKHVGAWSASGETAAVYANRHGLVVQSLYQAKHRLKRAPRAAVGERPRFARVEVRSEPAVVPERAPVFRMRLASGVVLEWWSVPEASEIAALIEREQAAR